ncbi:hypothetical protein FB567DRAFT_540867 [Paraphoma chrysanthemicola]|uniref:C2H2-type domain-containing protein n=1 Tax=Paraphoma chrysanthemicola TaxID=798071 RepID=A0A8K0QU04_9PLEO|nr:hypothetical protein FB567DRAFT_540867 [Paraphoma chrysanthemicola]
MFSENVDDLLSTLSHPPWTEPLNWGRYMTMYGEERIPFHVYVNPGATASSRQDPASSFSYFTKLPVELQDRVLTFCSASSLFQLMHVSAALRIEASKLFWANPNALFHVESHWILRGAYPGYACHDLGFLARAQNIEIEYQAGMDEEICPQEDGVTSETRPDLITHFWASFAKCFPNAKRVIINQNWATPLWRKDLEPVPQALRALLQFCSLDIRLGAFVLEEKGTHDSRSSTMSASLGRWQRSLYWLEAGHSWVRAESYRHPKPVLMPMKQFNGPIGEWERPKYTSLLVRLQVYGLWPLMVEALDRYHFDNGKSISFVCPLSECDAFFSKAGEWTVHAAVAHYEKWLTGDRFAILPDALRVLFEERERSLELGNKEICQEATVQLEKWTRAGEDERRGLQRAWLEQLENDPAWSTDKRPAESQLWKEFATVVEI